MHVGRKELDIVWEALMHMDLYKNWGVNRPSPADIEQGLVLCQYSALIFKYFAEITEMPFFQNLYC